MKRPSIYLDHNATTPLHPDVTKALKKWTSEFGNPSSLYATGRDARERVETARDQLAALVGALPSEIIFTGSATESNNHVFYSVLHEFWRSGQRAHVVISSIEHSSVLEMGAVLQGFGVDVSYVRVDRNGRIDLGHLVSCLRPDTHLISVMAVNNEVGAIQPIAEIGLIARENGSLFHVDAVQAIGKIHFDLSQIAVDYASFSGHKLYAPKGVGALYIRESADISPLFFGGAQERQIRAGTENVLGITAFGLAAEKLKDEWVGIADRHRIFRRQLCEGLTAIPDCVIHGHATETVPGTVCVSFKGVSGDSLVMKSDMVGIYISSGSACSTGSTEPSHVLMAMTGDAELARSTVRFSFGRATTHAEIQTVLDVLPSMIKTLRESR